MTDMEATILIICYVVLGICMIGGLFLSFLLFRNECIGRLFVRAITLIYAYILSNQDNPDFDEDKDWYKEYLKEYDKTFWNFFHWDVEHCFASKEAYRVVLLGIKKEALTEALQREREMRYNDN